MKRLTYRDNEGRAQWAPELLEDNTGMAALGGEMGEAFLALFGKETPPKTLSAKMEAQE